SSRNRPPLTSLASSRLVAAMIRVPTVIVSVPPTRSNDRSSRKRSSFAWSCGGSSPTSSRNAVPPSAASSRPGLSFQAPVNAPRTCPKSSLSRRCSASVVHVTVTNGRPARGLQRWIAAATRFFPTPLSPVTRMVASDGAARRAVARTRCMRAFVASRSGGVAEGPVLSPQRLDLEKPTEYEADLVERERLHEVIVRPGPDGLDGVRNRGVRGHEDHAGLRVVLAQRAQEGEPVHARHAH